MRALVCLLLLGGVASATTLEYEVSRGDTSRTFTVVLDNKTVRADVSGFLDTATATGTHVTGNSALLGGKVEFDLAERGKVTEQLGDAYIRQMLAKQTVGKDDLAKKAHEQFAAERARMREPLSYKATGQHGTSSLGACTEYTVDGGTACLLPFTAKIDRASLGVAGQIVETSLLFDPLTAPGIPATVKSNRYTLTLKSIR